MQKDIKSYTRVEKNMILIIFDRSTHLPTHLWYIKGARTSSILEQIQMKGRSRQIRFYISLAEICATAFAFKIQ